MHPLESKAYRTVFEAISLCRDSFISFNIYNININEEFVNVTGVGEKLTEEFILPHILENEYDLVIDVHSTIQEVNDNRNYSSFIFAPFNPEIEESLKKLSDTCNIYYFQPETYSAPLYVQKIIDNNIDLIYFETSSYNPMSISYMRTKCLIDLIRKLYD